MQFSGALRLGLFLLLGSLAGVRPTFAAVTAPPSPKAPPPAAAATKPTADAFAQGIELYKKSDYKGALAQFEQAAEKDPNDPVVQAWLGYVLLRLERPGDAI